MLTRLEARGVGRVVPANASSRAAPRTRVRLLLTHGPRLVLRSRRRAWQAPVLVGGASPDAFGGCCWVPSRRAAGQDLRPPSPWIVELDAKATASNAGFGLRYGCPADERLAWACRLLAAASASSATGLDCRPWSPARRRPAGSPACASATGYAYRRSAAPRRLRLAATCVIHEGAGRQLPRCAAYLLAVNAAGRPPQWRTVWPAPGRRNRQRVEAEEGVEVDGAIPKGVEGNQGGSVEPHGCTDGQVTSIAVVHSSGSSTLDAAAMAVFHNARLHAPFPARHARAGERCGGDAALHPRGRVIRCEARPRRNKMRSTLAAAAALTVANFILAPVAAGCTPALAQGFQHNRTRSPRCAWRKSGCRSRLDQAAAGMVGQARFLSRRGGTEGCEAALSKVHIVVQPDGEVSAIHLEEPSKSKFLNNAAYLAFRDAHLHPFPPGTPAPQADVHITLHYVLTHGEVAAAAWRFQSVRSPVTDKPVEASNASSLQPKTCAGLLVCRTARLGNSRNSW